MKLNEIHTKTSPYKTCSFDLDNYVLHIFISTDDQSTAPINEAKQKGTPLRGIYSTIHHKVPSPGKEHIHVYAKNYHLFALNIDGTAHDNSHGIQIPNKVADAIRTNFPSFILPSNNLIESAPLAIFTSYKYQTILG